MIITRSSLKDLVYQVNGAAIEVHKNIGAGLLENVECKNKWLNDVTRFLDFYKLDGLQCGGK